MSQAWVASLTAVAADGNATQLYPTFCPTGTAKASASPGDQIRKPCEGKLHSLQVETDGSNGGLLQVYDISGEEAGANVSSLAVITNAQLTAMISSGKARLIFEKTFAAATGAETVGMGQFRSFAKGLAARFSNAGPTGTCELNMVVTGGYRLNEVS